MDFRLWLCLPVAWLIELALGDLAMLPRPELLMRPFLRATGRWAMSAATRFANKKPPERSERLDARFGAAFACYAAALWFLVPAVALACARDANPFLYYALQIFFLLPAFSARSLGGEARNMKKLALAPATAPAPAPSPAPSRAAPQAAPSEKNDADAAHAFIRAVLSMVARRTVQESAAPALLLLPAALLGVPAPFVTALAALRLLAQDDALRKRPAFAKPVRAASEAVFFLPARFFAAAFPLCALLGGKDARACARAVRDNRMNRFDRNSAICDAAFSGALGVRVGAGGEDGPPVGEDKKLPDPADISQAARLSLLFSFLCLIMDCAALLPAVRF